MLDAGYRVLKPGRVLVDHGPITMVITAWANREPATEAAAAGAREALRLLEELADHLDIARTPVNLLAPAKDDMYPEVLRRMIKAVRMIEEDDFTPMAAVAGSFSDLVLERMLSCGAESGFVNNGGDIALRLALGEVLRVGIVQDLSRGDVTHLIKVNAGDDVQGIATSGFGGRSLTKGVASAATVLAENAAVADAAATAVANATNCDCPQVARCLAQEIDGLTDIPGHIVTKNIGRLNNEDVRRALENGFARLMELKGRGVVNGGVIFVQGESISWPHNLAQPLR